MNGSGFPEPFTIAGGDRHEPLGKTALGRVVNNIEETLIALILGLMTLIQFANVVVRYWFADQI